jgi:UDP:flavonoid glycosyltransferase YjiC (YdhE family)
VVPLPSDWPKIAHITGYWKLPPGKTWKPPRDLVEFLQNGPPPAFYSPGSIRSGEIRRIVNDLILSARKHHYRVILTLDEKSIPANIMGEDIYFATEIPHAWLSPQASVIIHHGGAGTTGAAIMAGVPSIAIPFSADQFFWTDRLDRLLVGPHSISTSNVSPDTIDSVFAELKTGKDFIIAPAN